MFTQQHLLPTQITSEVIIIVQMHVAVHSPWLPGYSNVTQTILVILIMAGHFLERPHLPYDLMENRF